MLCMWGIPRKANNLASMSRKIENIKVAARK
jgi:hypothetical protein